MVNQFIGFLAIILGVAQSRTWANIAAIVATACALAACGAIPGSMPGSVVVPLLRPPMLTVAEWGGVATTPQNAAPQNAAPQRIDRITIHHGGVAWKPDADVAAYMRRLQQWSRLTKRWSDSPYHYIIAPEGRIYIARDEGVAGDTNTEYNPSGHALVMLLGNFDEIEPTHKQLAATAELVAWIATKHGLSTEALATHKDFSTQTTCPGKNLIRHISSGWLRKAVDARMNGWVLPEMPG